MITAIIVLAFSPVRAADRTKCYLPVAVAESLVISDARQAILLDDAGLDLSIAAAGVFPTDAIGINASATGGDRDWSAYLQIWRAHHSEPTDGAIRGWFGIPIADEVQINARRGRSSPRFLPWKAGSFAVVQTPHFEILSRCDADDSKRIARDVERLYWVWTQMYFPLWSGRDQVAVAMEDWDGNPDSVAEHLSQKPTSRLTSRNRHRIVLLPDEKTYRLTISNRAINAGASSNIAASEGFYSDSLTTSFFYPQDNLSGLAHEITHQLFEEATDRPRRGSSTSTTDSFWMIEGVAGHFESFYPAASLASVGGWDAFRLQFVRYQTMIAGQPIAASSDLQGDRARVQRMPDLARWYSQSILRTHFAIDGRTDEAKTNSRAEFLRDLADVYGVDVTDFQSLRIVDNESVLDDPSAILRFLNVTDSTIQNQPTHGGLSALCLAGCEITNLGWPAVPPQTRINWFDASRTPINDTQVIRILDNADSIEQLSIEATKITPAIGVWLRRQSSLRELDLSWTAIDDSVVKSLAACDELKTLWLTGTSISDAAIDDLLRMPKLETLDVQRTGMTDVGLQRLRTARPNLELNPLVIPGG